MLTISSAAVLCGALATALALITTVTAALGPALRQRRVEALDDGRRLVDTEALCALGLLRFLRRLLDDDAEPLRARLALLGFLVGGAGS